MVAACAETDAPSVSAAAIGNIHLGVMGGSLLQAGGDVFGMLLVALENLETSLQQALQLRGVRVGNKRYLQRAMHCVDDIKRSRLVLLLGWGGLRGVGAPPPLIIRTFVSSAPPRPGLSSATA